MIFDEHLYSVLLVSSSEKFNTTMRTLLPEMRYDPVTVVTSVNAAQRALQDRSYDLLIINAPLPDAYGSRLAAEATVNQDTIPMIFVRTEQADELYAKLNDQGVYIIPKPCSTQTIETALRWLCTTRERLRNSKKKNASLEARMEEIRLINRAKWLLIENLKMSEEDAHKYIERQAMDRCVKKREIANDIIRTYS